MLNKGPKYHLGLEFFDLLNDKISLLKQMKNVTKTESNLIFFFSSCLLLPYKLFLFSVKQACLFPNSFYLCIWLSAV